MYVLAMVLVSIRIQDFHYLMAAMGKNVIIFGADVSSSVHVDNKGKDILIVGEGPAKDKMIPH